jgi:hypothetical protein
MIKPMVGGTHAVRSALPAPSRRHPLGGYGVRQLVGLLSGVQTKTRQE